MTRYALLGALLLSCTQRDEVVPTPDTGVEPEDVAPVLPMLDPSKCGAVTGDESPMALGTPLSATLETKLFPLFAELEADATILAAVRSDPALAAIAAPREERWRTACSNAACASFSAAEATAAADALATLLAPNSALLARLRASGVFNAYATLEGAAFLQKIAYDELLAASKAIADFSGEVADKAKASAVTRTSPMAFFEPTVALALANLVGASRDQAIQYEPLEKKENAAAVAAIASIDWKKYPFTAILLPGLGPTDLKTALSEGGRDRCNMALQRYAAGLAPLIAVSGGHVHPDRTPWSEAIEMKKYLVSKGIPPSSILIDPHARHTTTNLRNVGRLLLRYGVPADRPVLITTDLFQSLYIVGRPFALRCQEEIGYEPWRKLASLSINDGCYFPSRITLTVDPRDPRDP